MLLFGLEGSGFIISLALTLLIAGAIMFYCLRRFKILESSLVEQGKILQTFIIKYQTADFTTDSNLEAPGALEAARNQTKMIDIDKNNKIEVSDDDDEPNTSDSEYSDQSSENEEKLLQMGGDLEVPMLDNLNDIGVLGSVKVISMTNLEEGLSHLINDSSSSELEEKLQLDKKDLPIEQVTDITEVVSLEDDSLKTTNLKSLKVSELKELALKNNLVTQDSVKNMKKEQLLNLFSEN